MAENRLAAVTKSKLVSNFRRLPAMSGRFRVRFLSVGLGSATCRMDTDVHSVGREDFVCEVVYPTVSFTVPGCCDTSSKQYSTGPDIRNMLYLQNKL